MAKRKAEEDRDEATITTEATAKSKRPRLSDDGVPRKQDAKINKKDKKTKGKASAAARVEASGPLEPLADQDEPLDDATEEAAPKNKKTKPKKKVKKAQSADTADGDAENAETKEEAADINGGDDKAKAEPNEPSRFAKKSRFIVFVGNLPFSATVPDIEKHFSAVRPTSIRLLHQKSDPSKSRGVAFVEFAGYDTMKTCLKTLHHSTMTVTNAAGGRDRSGRPRPKTEERRINVELTAGGGGNTAHRKQKIREKNEKLNEERERRAVEEDKAKAKKELERLKKEGERQVGEDGIHPSRRARVPGRS